MSREVQKRFKERYPQYANTSVMISTDWCRQHRREHGEIAGGACDSCLHKITCDQFVHCGIELFIESR